MFFHFKIALKTISKLGNNFCFELNSSFYVCFLRPFIGFSKCLDFFLDILDQNWIENKFIGVIHIPLLPHVLSMIYEI